MPAKITIVGSSNVDFIMKVPSLPKVGETITGGTFVQTFGGKGANQAVAAARAGADVHFISSIGKDVYHRELLSCWHEDGISTEGVQILEDSSTGTALVMFDEKGDNYLTVSPGANNALTPRWVRRHRQIIESSDIVIMQMEIPPESIDEVLDMCKASNTKVIFNYAPANLQSIAVDDRIHTLMVNETEAASLLGWSSFEPSQAAKAADHLLAKGCQRVVVTMGEHGVYLLSKEEQIRWPCYEVKAVDTTAAGDTFCGSYAVAISSGLGLEESIAFASAASALCVSKVGAQPSIPTHQEIEAFMKLRA